MAGEIAGQSNWPASSKCLAHRGVEIRDAKRLGEQIGVDVRETGQILIKRPRTPTRRRVQHLEQPSHPGTEIRDIGGRAFLDELKEDVARLEDSGVVGEQAEDDPHEEVLQVVPS